MATMRRDTLKKMIAAGKLEARCVFSYTDDYAFDNANKFGETGWLPARMSHPKWEEIILPNGNKTEHCIEHDDPEGYINFRNYMLEGNGGHASKEDNGIMRLRVHSNLVFDLRPCFKSV
jgi:hypothetical protein